MPFVSGKLFKSSSNNRSDKKELESRALLEKMTMSQDESDMDNHSSWKVPVLSGSSISSTSEDKAVAAITTTANTTTVLQGVQLNDTSLFDDTSPATDDEEEYDEEEYALRITTGVIKEEGDDEEDECRMMNNHHNGEGTLASFCDSLCNSSGDGAATKDGSRVHCQPSTWHCDNDATCISKYNSNVKLNMAYDQTFIQARLFRDFTYLLGTSSTPSTDERRLFFNPSDIFQCITKFSSTIENAPVKSPTTQQQQFRNRAGESWRSRAYRIKRLREEIMVKVKDNRSRSLSQSQQYPRIMLSKSMNDASPSHHHHSNDRERQNIHTNNKKTEPDFIGCGGEDDVKDDSNVDSDKITLIQLDDLGLYYDSDPEVYSSTKSSTLQRNNSTEKKKKRNKSKTKTRTNESFTSSYDNGHDNQSSNADFLDRLISECDNDDAEEKDASSSYCLEQENLYSKNHTYDLVKKFSNVNALDDATIHQAVQETLNQTFHLTWHPTSELLSQESSSNGVEEVSDDDDDDDDDCCNSCYTGQKDNSNNNRTNGKRAKRAVFQGRNLSPRCVEVWFERGSRIGEDGVIQPKMMWRDSYHPELDSRRKLNLSSTQSPYQVSLLSICRLREMTNQHIDRSRYPLAKSSCSFQIKTCHDDEILFEAKSQEERSQIVHFWKLVVARLASQAVVGDGDGMVDEYFVPSSYGVPGGASVI